MNIREKLEQLIKLLKAKEKNDSIKDVEDFIGACGEYVDKVNTMEAAILAAKNYLDVKEYSEYKNAQDIVRHNAHEKLIIYVSGINRYCKSNDILPIYTGDDNRVHIGDFAF